MSASNVNPGPARPFWVIWLFLVGGLALVLAAAFLLDKQFGARIGIQGAVGSSASRAAVVAVASGSPAASTPANAALPSLPAGSGPADMTSPISQEVQAAYLHYWDVYSDALLRVDASQVSQVASGGELGRIQAEVDGVRKQNEAVRISVEHHFVVFNVSPSQANVYDEIQNRSFTVDPATKQPAEAPSDKTDVEKDTYFFQKQDGGWTATRSTRQRNSGQ